MDFEQYVAFIKERARRKQTEERLQKLSSLKNQKYQNENLKTFFVPAGISPNVLENTEFGDLLIKQLEEWFMEDIKEPRVPKNENE